MNEQGQHAPHRTHASEHDGLTILDGGMGKQLERAGAPFRQPEWSALALIEAPDAVREAHSYYIDAGADVIIVNAYAVVPFHLGDERFEARGAELAGLAGQLARQAAKAADRPVRVAGTVPPIWGSYQPELFRPDEAPEVWDLLVAAQAPYVDFWIGETVSSIAEARAIIAAVERFDPDAELWISFTVPDELPDDPTQPVTLRSGESIADAAAAIGGDVDAILFNCSPFEAISLALEELHRVLGSDTTVRTGGYPNGFEEKREGYAANEVLLARRDDLTAEVFRDTCASWVEGGATIIGGCCQVFPEDIAQLSALR